MPRGIASTSCTMPIRQPACSIVLDGGAALVLEVVVRAERAAYGRELLAPVQHQRLRDVAAVKDQVHRGELLLERAAQQAGVADRARHVGVGEDGDAHRAMVRAMRLTRAEHASRAARSAHGRSPWATMDLWGGGEHERTTAMAQRSHEVDYRIHGDDLQFVEVELDPGETVIGEAGAMMFLESGITFETKMGDGAEPEKGMFGKLMDAGKRALAGESLFITHFTNTGRGKQLVAFSAEFPGKIVPIDLDDMGGEIIAQKDAFLCAALGTKIDIAFRRNLGVGLFGGEGFILQRLQGDGMAFLSVGGTVVEKRLEGDKLLVDTGCLVAMEPGVDYQIERAGNLKSQFFGGEGLFLASLSGHGRVWLQSMPFSRLANRILENAPRAGGNAQGEGSILGGLGLGQR